MHGMFGCGGWYGSLFSLLVLGLIVWFVIYLIGQNRNRKPRLPENGYNETALEILKKRYANGEISREEYERMKRELL